MYAYIKGKLVEATSTSVVIEAYGIGYDINIPANHFGKLPVVGQEITLYTSLIIREDAHTLYGFLTRTERELFDTLQNVSGIGPKLALSLTGHLGIGDLQQAIGGGDVYTLSKVPGVGKKTAERLVVELKDKLSVLFPRDIPTPREGACDVKNQLIRDAVSALVNLGYSQATAHKAIQKALKETSEDDIDLPTLITTCLAHI